MNKILVIALVFAVIFLTLVISLIIGKVKNKKNPAPVTAALIAAMVLTAAGCAFTGFFSVYYHALPEAEKYLSDSGGVTVTRDGGGYFFDGPGE